MKYSFRQILQNDKDEETGEYETVSCDFGGWGLGSGNIYGIEDYRSTIKKERLADGDMWAIFQRSSEESVILRN